jgi:hypothetical protein
VEGAGSESDDDDDDHDDGVKHHHYLESPPLAGKAARLWRRRHNNNEAPSALTPYAPQSSFVFRVAPRPLHGPTTSTITGKLIGSKATQSDGRGYAAVRDNRPFGRPTEAAAQLGSGRRAAT